MEENELMEPFKVQINMQTGVHQPTGQIIQRHLSDLKLLYTNAAAVNQILNEKGDCIIYEVHVADLPEAEGGVLYCTTIIYPGRVGDEYHMTKGHFHEKRDRAEVYLGLAGTGYLLLQSDEGTVRAIPMQTGTVAYVPPMWGHRTANSGDEPFIFFAAWPGDAGHDYGAIERLGFAKLLVKEGGQPALVDNPQYKTIPK